MAGISATGKTKTKLINHPRLGFQARRTKKNKPKTQNFNFNISVPGITGTENKENKPIINLNLYLLSSPAHGIKGTGKTKNKVNKLPAAQK